jgi:DNA-binding response OmpR family regulator
VAQGLGVGADGYMTKPFSTKDLAARVRAMLG